MKNTVTMRLLTFALCSFSVLLPLPAQEVQKPEKQVEEAIDTVAANMVPAPYFGYISYKSIFTQMPAYAKAKEDFATLKAKYEAEAERAEKEFQRKFAEYLSGQSEFPESIMRKRQGELQDLMDKSVSFRQESQRLLQQAEAEMQAPIAQELDAAIQQVAQKHNLHFVLNTDDQATPYLNPAFGLNITPLVLKLIAK